MTVVLLWDIDGTLLSTARAGVFALERAAAAMTGREIDLQSMQTAGLTDAQIAQAVLELAAHPAGEAEVKAFLSAYADALPGVLGRRAGQVLPGVREALEDLDGERGVLSLLLTGNVRAGAWAKLAHYGLDGFFTDGAFCEGVGGRELIAHRALRLATDLLGSPPDLDACVLIGDTPADVACAQAIGVRALTTATGRSTREDLLGCGAWLAFERLPAPAELRRLIGLGEVG